MNYLLLLFLTILPTSNIKRKLLQYEYETTCKFKITSHNRTIGHNMKVGGAPRSLHLVPGLAYDLVKVNGCPHSYKVLESKCEGIFDWCRAYNNHIHVDLRGELKER